MTVEEFRKAFRTEIKEVLEPVTGRFGVSDEDVSTAIFNSAKKYLRDSSGAAAGTEQPDWPAEKVLELIRSINYEDLCLALACAKGDDAAWEHFYKEYRGFLLNIARMIAQEAGAAEQLADSTFADLFGLRESDGARISKFSFYSGRGSLKGWLRAVVYQLSADQHRKVSRYVQPDENEDLDRIAAPPGPNGHADAELAFVGERYNRAVAQSLQQAMADIEGRERLLLAHYYYDQMTLREIGKLFSVHEATVCRWLTRTQQRLRKLVEKDLAKTHHFNRRQIEEAMEQIAEKVDINVGDYLFDSLAADRDTPDGLKTARGRGLVRGN